MSNQIERIEKEGKENFIFTAVTGEAVSLARSRFEIANDGLKILFILEDPLFFPTPDASTEVVREDLMTTDHNICLEPPSNNLGELWEKIRNLLK